MGVFSFRTDEKAEIFCKAIVSEMVRLFSISEEEAIGRINRAWAGQDIIGEDIVYHEDETYWAKTLYYGKASHWWHREGDPTLKPIPYP